MSRHDTLWADRLLVDVREQADPTASDAARNLASLERRLQLPGPGGGAGPDPTASAGTLLQLRSGATPTPGPALASAPGLKSAVVLGRWLAFGTTTALLGYLGGRIESQRELAWLEQRHAQQLELERGQARQLTAQQPPQGQVLPAPVPPLPERAEPAPVAKMEPLARKVPARATSSAQPAPAQLAQPATPDQHLRDAIALLRRAEAELREGDAFTASLLLSDLDRTVPQALLREERLATRALVACALDEPQPAREALHELEQLNPESIYRARVQGCAEKARSSVSKDPASPH